MLYDLIRHDDAVSAAALQDVDHACDHINVEPTLYCLSPLSGRPIDDIVAIRGPVVETRRLRLRPLKMDDYADYSAMMADPANWIHMGVGPMNGEESWMRFLRSVGHWQSLGYGTFGVFDRDTDHFLGEVGFAQYNRNLGGHFDWAPEACWMIAGDRKNDGVATEAVAGALTWMERSIGATRTVCIIPETNRASLRVAEKLGFRPFKKSEFKGSPAVFLERVVIGL